MDIFQQHEKHLHENTDSPEMELQDNVLQPGGFNNTVMHAAMEKVAGCQLHLRVGLV